MKRWIRGQQLYIFTGALDSLTPIGCSTDCSLELTAATVAGARRGNARRQRAGLKSWGVSCLGFVAEGGNFSALNKIGQPITVATTVLREELIKLGVQASSLSPDEVITLVGRAIVTNVRYKGSHSSLATAEIVFTGSGELGELRKQGGFTYIFPINF